MRSRLPRRRPIAADSPHRALTGAAPRASRMSFAMRCREDRAEQTGRRASRMSFAMRCREDRAEQTGRRVWGRKSPRGRGGVNGYRRLRMLAREPNPGSRLGVCGRR